MKYEHPAILGLFPEVFREVMSFSETLDKVEYFTLTAWADWLEQRRCVQKAIRFKYDKGNRSVMVEAKRPCNLSQYGIAVQYEDNKVYVKNLGNDKRQNMSLEEFKTFLSVKNESMIGETIYNPKEISIHALNSRYHLKKLISNYGQFYQYRFNRFYLN